MQPLTLFVDFMLLPTRAIFASYNRLGSKILSKTFASNVSGIGRDAAVALRANALAEQASLFNVRNMTVFIKVHGKTPAKSTNQV